MYNLATAPINVAVLDGVGRQGPGFVVVYEPWFKMYVSRYIDLPRDTVLADHIFLPSITKDNLEVVLYATKSSRQF